MSWDELKDLSVKHVIGSHTFTHHRMNIKDSDDILKKEIINSKLLIEKKLNSEVDIFCWVGGEERTYTKKAAKYIDKAGYSYSFMTNTYPITKKTDSLQLQRTNIESFFPLEVVKFQLCGLLDLYYSFKRYRVNRITKLIQS
jgi:peptidoglycan/xylan/chitin deacetylase (PgdA/CDA1 family)